MLTVKNAIQKPTISGHQEIASRYGIAHLHKAKEIRLPLPDSVRGARAAPGTPALPRILAVRRIPDFGTSLAHTETANAQVTLNTAGFIPT